MERLLASWQRDSGAKPPTNLKKWLKTNHYLPTDQAEIDADVENAAAMACRDGLSVKSDLVGLGLHIQDLGSVSGLPQRAPD